MNAYEKTRELIIILSNIDKLTASKEKFINVTNEKLLDKKINDLELQMFEIINSLKNVNAYKLSRQFITVISDIDTIINKKEYNLRKNITDNQQLDKKIDELELQMLKIKNQLKNKQVI